MRVFAQITYIVLVIACMFAPLYFWPVSLGRIIARDSTIPNFNIVYLEKIRVIEQLNFFHITGESSRYASEYLFSSPSEVKEVYGYLSSLRLIRRLTSDTTFWNATHNYTIIFRLSGLEDILLLNNSDRGVFLEIGGNSYRVLMNTDGLYEFHKLLMELK